MKISTRIKTIAKHVPEGAIVADIGTDHGYLLYYLLEQGKITKGIGCDVNKNPLSFAKKNLADYINDNKACLSLGDGLKAVAGHDFDCIVIAGMGGLLIKDIIQADTGLARMAGCLVLSPNLAADKLRLYLADNGWKIVDEDLVLEDGKYYPVIIAERGASEKISECDAFFGPILIKTKHPLLMDFFKKEEEKVTDVMEKIKASGHVRAQEMIDDVWKNWKRISGCIHGT